jgi:hypothetical protein
VKKLWLTKIVPMLKKKPTSIEDIDLSKDIFKRKPNNVKVRVKGKVSKHHGVLSKKSVKKKKE